MRYCAERCSSTSLQQIQRKSVVHSLQLRGQGSHSCQWSKKQIQVSPNFSPSTGSSTSSMCIGRGEDSFVGFENGRSKGKELRNGVDWLSGAQQNNMSHMAQAGFQVTMQPRVPALHLLILLPPLTYAELGIGSGLPGCPAAPPAELHPWPLLFYS